MEAAQAREIASERLARRGLRATPRRVQVLAELLHEPNDATALQLHERLRGRGERVGIATVYRTLNAFVEHGIADALSHHPGERCYRLCGEGHHHHLVCTACHRVVEVEGCTVGTWLDGVAAAHGFEAVDHRLEAVGICPDCH